MNRIAKSAVIVAVLGAGISILAACGVLNSLSGTGRLRVSITDKPFPFEFIESAKVTLTRVEVRQGEPSDESSEEGEGEDQIASSQPASDDDSDGPFITIYEDAAGKEFDLVLLRNGKTDLLAEAELPAGHYTQMRLVVSSGEVTLTDGRVFPLKVPSGEQSGIKLHFEFDVVADQDLDLLLDVDLSRAFTPIPGGHIDDVSTIRLFHFSPSIAMRLITLQGSGQIAGLVTDATSTPLAGVAVTAFSGDTEMTSTSTEDDGTYALIGLPPGTYDVTFSANDFDDAEVTDVEVSSGQTTPDVNVVMNPQTSDSQVEESQ